jgi:hypothetical protein
MLFLFRNYGAEGRGVKAPLILKLCTVWRWAVTFRQCSICEQRNRQITRTYYLSGRLGKGKGNCKGKGNGKAMPVQDYTGPESSKRVRFLDFITISNKCFKFVIRKHRPPLPHEIFLVLIAVRRKVDPAVIQNHVDEKLQ